ncbi:hypothetical protein MferCBS31731_000346 [Microsporum ferrugineum]
MLAKFPDETTAIERVHPVRPGSPSLSRIVQAQIYMNMLGARTMTNIMNKSSFAAPEQRIQYGNITTV